MEALVYIYRPLGMLKCLCQMYLHGKIAKIILFTPWDQEQVILLNICSFSRTHNFKFWKTFKFAR